MQEVNVGALIRLKHARHLLSYHQYKTLRGQVLAGDPEGAMRGLQKLLQKCSDKQKKQCFTENITEKERNQ